jgi:hypothetical protein
MAGLPLTLGWLYPNVRRRPTVAILLPTGRSPLNAYIIRFLLSAWIRWGLASLPNTKSSNIATILKLRDEKPFVMTDARQFLYPL